MKKRIVITGGSSGIGRAVALTCAKDSHHLFLIGRDEKKLQGVKQEVVDAGGTAIIAVGDVSDESTVEEHYRRAQDELGGVDVLFANAGVGYFGNLEDLTIQQFDEQFDTNVRGVFLWMKKVLPEMKERNSGQIIVTSSNLGLKTSPRGSIYAATKHAVQAMVWSLRDELRGTKVKASTINPGSVDTPWFDGKDVDRSFMLSSEDVAKATKLIIDQSETSDIDHIHIMPGKRRTL